MANRSTALADIKLIAAMNGSQAQGGRRQISLTSRSPDAQQSGNGETNLDDEEEVAPDRRVSDSPSGLLLEEEDHVGDQAEAQTKSGGFS